MLELARLFLAFGETTAMECIVLKAAVVIPSFLLQTPSTRGRCKEFVELSGNLEIFQPC